jgi:enoyl-CoA hydratase/carnithine racemase
MSPFVTIRCQQEERVLRVTLHRPQVLNAINGQMLVELRAVLATAERDPEVGVILIDSASDRAFSAGIDVGYVKDLQGFAIREVGRELHRTFLALRTTEKPVVAAIDGLCLGAGLELAVSCDLLLASDRSEFGLPNIHRGIPAIVEAAILPLVIGLQGAKELAYMGERWGATKAERRGLLNAVVPSAELGAEVERWCQKLASKPAPALATQKEIIHKWMTTDLESAIDFSVNTVMLNFSTREQQEGMQSFLDKRQAHFR